MKVWYGFGSEHSANLVLIGEFETADLANETLDLLNEATDIARADEAAGRLNAGTVLKGFTDDQMEFFKKTNLSFNYGDPESLLFDFDAKRVDSSVVITTEEFEIGAFMKTLLHKGAKIQVYSAHDHPDGFGR